MGQQRVTGSHSPRVTVIRLVGRGDLDEEMEHLAQGCAEPMVFGFSRDARGARPAAGVVRVFTCPAVSHVESPAGERASWLPPLDSTREIDIILNTSYHRQK